MYCENITSNNESKTLHFFMLNDCKEAAIKLRHESS